jgi:hypothetical protein
MRSGIGRRHGLPSYSGKRDGKTRSSISSCRGASGNPNSEPTEELTRVALERVQASSSVLLSEEPVLKKVLQAVRDELEALLNQALTEVQIGDADLLVLDEGTVSPDQLEQMRQRQ